VGWDDNSDITEYLLRHRMRVLPHEERIDTPAAAVKTDPPIFAAAVWPNHPENSGKFILAMNRRLEKAARAKICRMRLMRR
jgi:hypothetical protein